MTSLPDPEPSSFDLIDDSVLQESFGALDIDCSSFISLPTNKSTCISGTISDTPSTSDIGPTQPNHVNSHSHSNTHSILHSRRSSIKKRRSTSSPLSRKKEGWYEDFKLLEQEYHRFTSKTGVNKANVLRLALLPFLRQQRGEFFKATPAENDRRVRILQKWWGGALAALRDRDRPVSGSDRSAYLEAISGIVARSEWIDNSAFQALLIDTLSYVISKLSLKTVPITFAAFAGKILAYAYFYSPGVAPALLNLLHVPKVDIRRVLRVSFSDPSHECTDLDTAAELLVHSFPSHLSPLIACTKVPTTPCPLPELNGPWSRRWTCFNSDVFYSFFKHYYTIISRVIPAELPLNAHLAAPGLIVIHASLLSTLDSVVHPRKPK